MQRPESLPPPRTEPPRLLVLDPDDQRRERYCDVLIGEGYALEVVSTQAEALAYVKMAPPDLVIVADRLAQGHGFELCRRVRTMEEARLTSVILLGGPWTAERDVADALLGGADDYVVTPERLDEFRARVRVQLRHRRDRELLDWARSQRARFRTEAMLDPLTSIANRRAAETALQKALDSGDSGLVLLIDVDHFKAINDGFGHLIGDKVLIELARALDSQTRRGDLVARYGGEEFVVLIHGANTRLASVIAGRFHAAIASLRFVGIPELPSITASIGVSGWEPSDVPLSPAEVLDAADKALYRAKRSGRNRVEFGIMLADPQIIAG